MPIRRITAMLRALGASVIDKTRGARRFSKAQANPDAMPVILTTPEEIEIWMTASWEEAKVLQRPLPPGVLKVVSVGPKEDPPEPIQEPSLF